MTAGLLVFVVVCFLIATGGGADEEASPVESGVAASSPAAAEQTDATEDDTPAPVEPVAESVSDTATETVVPTTQETTEAAEPASETDDAVATPADSAPTDDAAATPADSVPTDDDSGSASSEPADEAVSEPAEEEAAIRIGQPPADLELPPAPLGAPDRYALLSNGKVFLRGTVPTIEVETQIVSSLFPIMGQGNVISELAIDPAVPFDPDADNPVYNDAAVLFETGSAVIAPAFYELLATAPVLLQLQPRVTITLIGHTDSDGSAADNLVLSQQRVEAARDWIIAQGGDPERVSAIGMGETEPVADNATPEGRAANRRVESIISGFDFSIGG